MQPAVLVHLLDPAAWRAALSDGAVRPSSLSDVGFVHLSTPDQVHLPAQALHPGRRDLVLLVVDPARLTDAVRFEPGTPRDPADMRFPHLYGPLPVTAVIAAVPYRPPSPVVLPTAEDSWGRALALSLSVPVRRAADVLDVPGGVAVLDDRYPHSRADNRLLLAEPVDAGTIEEAAIRVAADARLPALSVALRWPGADDVAAALAARGWTAEELVLMARPAAPLPGGDRVEVVSQEDVHPLWNRSWRRGLAGRETDLDVAVGQLIAREHRNNQVLAVTDLVVREGGEVVAAGQLRMDGATATVDSVLTDPAARGRGHADAILARAVDLASAEGCDLVALEAAAAEWPRHWYARRGFQDVGTVWELERPTDQTGASAESSR